MYLEPYICEKCQARFKTKNNLDKHQDNAHRCNNCCPICGSVVKVHRARHVRACKPKPARFPCTKCGHDYPTQAALNQHQQGPHRCACACKHCGEIHVCHLERHERRCTSRLASFSCTKCRHDYPSLAALREHQQGQHGCACACKHCGEIHVRNLARHEHNCASRHAKFACNTCGQYCATEADLARHQQGPLGCACACPHCGGIHIRGLERHMKLCKDKITCQHCQRRFAQAEYGKHTANSTLQCAYTCHSCLQPCTSHKDLNLHLSTCADHGCVNAPTCALCHREFDTAAQLRDHVTLREDHSTVPCPLACRSCATVFSSVQDRQQHEKNCKQHGHIACTVKSCEHVASSFDGMVLHHKAMHLGCACHMCGFIGHSHEDLLAHWADSLCGYACRTCKAIFGTREQLASHAKSCEGPVRFRHRAMTALPILAIASLMLLESEPKGLATIDTTPDLPQPAPEPMPPRPGPRCPDCTASGCVDDCAACTALAAMENEYKYADTQTTEASGLLDPVDPVMLPLPHETWRLPIKYQYTNRHNKKLFERKDRKAQSLTIPRYPDGQLLHPCDNCQTLVMKHERHGHACKACKRGQFVSTPVPPPQLFPRPEIQHYAQTIGLEVVEEWSDKQLWVNSLSHASIAGKKERAANSALSLLAYGTKRHAKSEPIPNRGGVYIGGMPYVRWFDVDSSRIHNMTEPISKALNKQAGKRQAAAVSATVLPASKQARGILAGAQPMDITHDTPNSVNPLEEDLMDTFPDYDDMDLGLDEVCPASDTAKLPDTDTVYKVNNLTRMYIYEQEFASYVHSSKQFNAKAHASLTALQTLFRRCSPWGSALSQLNSERGAADPLPTAEVRFQIYKPSAGTRDTAEDPMINPMLAAVLFSDGSADDTDRLRVVPPTLTDPLADPEPRSWGNALIPNVKMQSERPPQFLDRNSPAYEPLAYPLLFPGADLGFSYLQDEQVRQLHIEPNHLPQSDSSYLLYMRQRVLRDFIHMDRLTQAYAIDMHVRHQDHQLKYLRSPIVQLQVRGIPVDAHSIGQKAAYAKLQTLEDRKRVYLPHSFSGNPSHMRTLCREALSVMARYGQPTYMITMTANSDWKEIQEMTVGNVPRADAICRVFDYKARQMIHHLVNDQPLGEVEYYTWVREYQKRGYPLRTCCNSTGTQPYPLRSAPRRKTAYLCGVDRIAYLCLLATERSSLRVRQACGYHRSPLFLGSVDVSRKVVKAGA
eukprot:TRINITY_DN12648_c1_g2_i11.p1 TRINITY_DN12648_c1_g2~~TRINITY_DN12648_c1_g2_i11.p1  ORF type:complete len:1224 (+),score=93.19 TRINITY_DN12648_c1_g2_i11:376-4047(+)